MQPMIPLQDAVPNGAGNAFRDDASLPGLDSAARMYKPAYMNVGGVNIDGRPSRRLMLVLRTNGCALFRAGHPCTMCGFHLHAVAPETATMRTRHLLGQYEAALDYAHRAGADFQQFDLLGLGSFLDDQEVPPDFRCAVLRRIARLPEVRKVVIESRAEFLTRSKLEALKACLRPDQILELGIGVESSNHELRNRVLRKGLSWAGLERAIATCAACGVSFQSYLLIKPQTLNEREAIADAVRSAEDVAALAGKYDVAFRLAFEPVFIVAATALERAFVAGEYRIVNLWSVVEVVRRCQHLGTVFVGTTDEDIAGGRVPQSCPRCGPVLRAALDRFNATQDLGVFDTLDCPCREAWEQEV